MNMDEANWNPKKDALLIARFGFGFERVLDELSAGNFLDERKHTNEVRYGHQYQLIVKIDGYAWVIPFVVDGEKRFFKTMFPSRVETKRYIGGTQ
jgi:hypothetical protein